MICGKSSGSEAPPEADGKLRLFSALEFQIEISPGRHFRHLNSNQQIHMVLRPRLRTLLFPSWRVAVAPM